MPTENSNPSAKNYAMPRMPTNTELPTIPEMVETIRSVFGLTVGQIANFVDVPRSEFLNQATGRLPGDPSKCRRLYELAVEVDKKVKMPLKDGLKRVIVDGMNLMDHIRDWSLHQDQAELREQVIEAALRAAKHLKEHGPPKFRKLTIHEQLLATAAIVK